ncbi:uncharacterized protein TRAVEDRAFT_124657 [Trametes versicolor FP-101664 SS1]|uniref:uncharacterized protein n=1 Tax=Trametes versicolor (strain FP-101664) TaxID=717944 RepID=UPI000462158B|nr:uncharacterized protein TRAVEDRAFT_124657 [Trametes versicolor FP-101664 SS1]EIW58914.1 hypothetical protein TRAVEDRAFT_124657 [Trametes versicolor FP-101664 SS1]
MVHSATIRRKDDTADSIQPQRNRSDSPTLSALIRINGIDAYALFDSGSTTDSLSPEFAYVAKAPRIVLEDQVTLQLGCAGSRSKISYGARVPVEICGIQQDHYFDIVNLDRYDCIIGTPFLNAHGAVLDFQNHCIRVNGKDYPSFSYDEDRQYRTQRQNRSATRKPGAPAHS